MGRLWAASAWTATVSEGLCGCVAETRASREDSAPKVAFFVRTHSFRDIVASSLAGGMWTRRSRYRFGHRDQLAEIDRLLDGPGCG